MQLTIYNSEDITLVRETRTVTFKKGVNPLQFSWANTLIDPTSRRAASSSRSADKLDVLDTTFPHDKPQMLYWNVQSEFDGEATIQITYFTSGITWSADYIVHRRQGREADGLRGFVRVTNNSGEEYEDAQVRLVVGTINLVEKIAQLAQIPMDEVEELADDRTSRASQGCGAETRWADGRWRRAGAGAPAADGREADHQGRPQRVLHLHHRRDRDDPQRLEQADAVASKGRPCRSRSSIATARRNTASSSCGCIC